MKTLMFLATHFIDEAVISEYRKLKNTPNVDAVLVINNNECNLDFENRIENKIFFDTSVKCFFFDSDLNDEMNLPYLTPSGIEKFGKVMWANGDYRFYYIRKFFPEYDYYWQIEYDIFCNAETYAGFLKKFAENHSDLLVQSFRSEKKNSTWCWTHGIDWIYKNNEVYGSFYPVVRLSARAIDFLYKRRLEHREIFQNSNAKGKQWVFCETFTPTELMNGGFSCENLNEPHIKFLPYIHLNDERFFLKPDNHLYHPVKSVKTEIDNLQKKHDDMLTKFKKVFLTQLVEKIILTCRVNVKDFPVRFDKVFNYVIFPIPNGGGAADISLRYEAHFIQENFLIGLVFEGNYVKDFGVLNRCTELNKIQPLQILSTNTGRMLAHVTPIPDGISQVANVLKILIESTYDVLQEKFL